MASKKKQSEASKSEAKETAESAEDTSLNSGAEPATNAADENPDTPEEPIEDAEVIEETASKAEPETVEAAAPEPDAEETPETESEVERLAETGPVPAPVPQPGPVVIRKGGFIPMVLGGIAAAAIGFGAARYMLPEGWPWPGARDDTFQQEITAKLDAQADALVQLKTEIGKAPDLSEALSPLETQLGDIQGSVQALASDLGAATARLDTLEARLSDLEKRPITESASPAAVAAYERELKSLQDAMAAQRAEIEKLAAEATQKEANAEITAQEAMNRAALSRIQTALDTGTGFADAADTLVAAGIALPPALLQAADTGVATRADLAASFPGAARAALTVARKSETGGGFGAFLKTQLGARSLEPREGDDPDAVLSRAEAAVQDGRFGDALAELEALPEDARAEMSEWLTHANTRLEALSAAETLAADLN